MNYCPTKHEIYSILLKNYVIKKIKTEPQNKFFTKKLVKVKLFEALISKNFLEPTNLEGFLESLFLRIESVLYADGKTVNIKLQGKGDFFVDRRLLTYIFLELAVKSREISVKICNKGIIVSANSAFSKNAKKLIKKFDGILLDNIAFIVFKKTEGPTNNFCCVLECLENEFSPEYLWL